MTWENALVFSANLLLAGHDDWRLPNINELQSLSEVSIANPSVNTSIFPEIGIKKYWASTSLPNQTTKAWYLDTRFGITTYAEKTGELNLLCVRGGQNNSVSTSDLHSGSPAILAFPNPFSDHVFLKNAPENVVCEMSSAIGQIIFSGSNIEKKDFSTLPTGLYFLKVSGNPVLILFK
jgi:hypothetical protein